MPVRPAPDASTEPVYWPSATRWPNAWLETGRSADICVWDWATGPVAQRRMQVARSLHERAFAWMTMADDRNLVATLVAGVARFTRAGAKTQTA